MASGRSKQWPGQAAGSFDLKEDKVALIQVPISHYTQWLTIFNSIKLTFGKAYIEGDSPFPEVLYREL